MPGPGESLLSGAGYEAWCVYEEDRSGSQSQFAGGVHPPAVDFAVVDRAGMAPAHGGAFEFRAVVLSGDRGGGDGVGERSRSQFAEGVADPAVDLVVRAIGAGVDPTRDGAGEGDSAGGVGDCGRYVDRGAAAGNARLEAVVVTPAVDL